MNFLEGNVSVMSIILFSGGQYTRPQPWLLVQGPAPHPPQPPNMFKLVQLEPHCTGPLISLPHI